ncbi:phosphomannomutase [Roseinatronobacter thiooxidans]|uniref:Phosphomannomutase n=1 Tax=Roseinatronobacter thiooxidans TaxID=121821 RepID=A0A2W7RH10_9RHOB|nr:phosphomannomutase [Roseinatronobacter thiooxidans]PZX37212.1 phosphomannomutase [Roseinatronobacter thiooxidans]
MAPKFGTSGLRGLVTDLTPDLIGAHVTAFLRACPVGTGLWVGRDLRDSSPRIAFDVIAAARMAGVDVTDCGAIPTPALALGAMGAGAAAVMITGSHIPADRNGLKFYTPAGEITKAEETGILANLGLSAPLGGRQGSLRQTDPGPDFVSRYLRAYGAQALVGQRIGVWSHSAVGRDLLIATLRALGAEVVEIARATRFIPIDTEAVSNDTRALLARAVATHGLDAIVSTDGDGDRPLLADATGQVVAGDVLGQITAQALGARVVVTPVSSNTGVEALGFDRIIRTKIGSPFVIAGMESAGETQVVGYEANGGFLLGFDATGPAGPLPRLMTRDSHLPILAPLVAAGRDGLAALVARSPARFTAADRLQDVPTDRSAALVTKLAEDRDALVSFVACFGAGSVATMDRTDGLRLTLSSGRIIHLRPSGNAPELRFYAEAESHDAAMRLLATGLEVLRQQR